MKAKQIVIESMSGYCPVNDMYSDKLTLTSNSIEYECHPVPVSFKVPQKWSYKTTNSNFTRVFERVAKAVEEILKEDTNDFWEDVGTVSFTITYMNGHIASDIFGLPTWVFDDCFKIIKEIVPSTEKIPEVLKNMEDYAAENKAKKH